MAFTQLPSNATISPKPFKVDIPDATLDELHTLLKYAKLAPETYEGSLEDRRYGVTNRWIREARDVWATKFDWRKHEAEINSFPNYFATIEDGGTDFNIHFVALFSEKPDAIPIVLLHGWPGSFLEFLPILAILRSRYTPSTLPYHLIVPSMPGYAFSSPPPPDRAFDLLNVARIFNTLMVGLGFGGGYVAQGGDIGSKVARVLSVQYDSCKAVHINFCSADMPYTGLQPVAELTAAEQHNVARATEFITRGKGYAIEQGTRPATLGIVLSSSPVALLAWIGEKFLEWTDADPPLDAILASVTLYWVTECIATSFYPYHQRAAWWHTDPEWHITKPLGYSLFPKEVFPLPKSWVATTGNLVFYKTHNKGGHFAAVEQAEVLLEDVEAFIKQVWKA
ncbi:alpha/beta-hydrolase [Athelia psychrophila]|uniref:Alpha/beta-hydrolase n=1 Tax=Athelia psychrophila TaxID=1759441 RepID=A0A166ST73_9AGAM|nr:alpha/beta-hydrolase [Fibularhizoctonia sp. CBS 109695]